jgi:hypothetical protein
MGARNVAVGQADVRRAGINDDLGYVHNLVAVFVFEQFVIYVDELLPRPFFRLAHDRKTQRRHVFVGAERFILSLLQRIPRPL